MSADGSMVVESEGEFRVATATYRDPAVFERELEEIFYSTWIYLGHESEIPNPGDFKSTRIGRRPVVVARELDGSIHAFLNFCPHRGAALCRQEYGQAKLLVCPYHSWSFRLSGEVVAVTDGARFPHGFAATKNLHKLPRVESYDGLIFGSFNPDVPTVGEHLGSARRHVDLWLARTADGRYRVTRPHKYLFRGNWKLQAENGYDGYHPSFVHGSALRAFSKMELAERSYQGEGGVRQEGRTEGFEGGHGALETHRPMEMKLSDALRQDYTDRVAATHGADQVEVIVDNRHILIYPSLILMDSNIRVIQPISHDRSEVYSYPTLIDGFSDEFNTARLLDVQLRLGATGMIGADDIEIFNAVQTGVATEAKWVSLSRGLDQEQTPAPDTQSGGFSDETPQRAFWRQWRKQMEKA